MVGNQTTFAVKLSEDSEALDEVVVVAYGTQKARAVTGSMSKLNNEELEDIPVPNISQKMQGKFSEYRLHRQTVNPVVVWLSVSVALLQ